MTEKELLKVIGDKKITPEQLEKVRDVLEDASKSDKPVPYIKRDDKTGEDEMYIRGDSNKTEVNKHDYKVCFNFPISAGQDGETTEDGRYTIQEIEYKDVFISPRTGAKLTTDIGELMPLVNKVAEGTIVEYTKEELAEVCEHMQDKTIDTIYSIVGEALGISDKLIPWAKFTGDNGVLENFIKLATNAPRDI